MCIRDRAITDLNALVAQPGMQPRRATHEIAQGELILASKVCLLYTSDAADERSSVDLGGRRIIKKKNTERGGGTAEAKKSNIDAD